MLQWPKRATTAIRLLFEPLQDVDVYVEDVDDEAFYRQLLNFAASGRVAVRRVFGLGGKPAVLAAALAHDHKIRRALYIVDGDLPWVRGQGPAGIVGLHSHNAYCVENLLVCEQALAGIVSQEVVLSQSDAAKLLNFAGWRLSVQDSLVSLFAAYATLNEFDPTVATVSNGVGALCIPRTKKQTQKLDHGKVVLAKNQALLAAESGVDAAVVAERYNVILQRIMSLPDPLLAISGKDYVVPLVQFHLNSVGCVIRTKTLRMRLAVAGDVARFRDLSDSLVRASKGEYAL